MELKKIILAIFFLSFVNSANAEMIKPAENLSAYDVIKIPVSYTHLTLPTTLSV